MTSSTSVLTPTADGCTISIYAQPGARRTEPAGFFNGALKLKIQAPPVEGKANDAVRDWLAAFFKIRPSQIKLIRGEKNRNKVFHLVGFTVQDAQKILKLL